MKKLLTYLLILGLLATVSAKEKPHIPEELQVAIFYKIVGFNQNLRGKVKLHVIGNKKIAHEFKQLLNHKMENAILAEVTSSDTLPDEKVDIIYIGKHEKTDKILKFCDQHDIMSITDKEKIILAGASLGLTVEGGKPRILIGLKGTKNERINWKAVIFKLGRAVKE